MVPLKQAEDTTKPGTLNSSVIIPENGNITDEGNCKCHKPNPLVHLIVIDLWICKKCHKRLWEARELP